MQQVIKISLNDRILEEIDEFAQNCDETRSSAIEFFLSLALIEMNKEIDEMIRLDQAAATT